MMESFNERYVSKCAELGIEPMPTVLKAVTTSKKNMEEGTPAKFFESLDLSSQSIPLKACLALSNAISDDCFFTRLILADAFLGDDGIAIALMHSSISH